MATHERVQVEVGKVVFVNGQKTGPDFLQVGPVVEGRVKMTSLLMGRTFEADWGEVRGGNVNGAKVVDVVPTRQEAGLGEQIPPRGTITFPRRQ